MSQLYLVIRRAIGPVTGTRSEKFRGPAVHEYIALFLSPNQNKNANPNRFYRLAYMLTVPPASFPPSLYASRLRVK